MLDAMLESSPPDVIVLDLLMPVMDGHGFLAARAETPAMTEIPVVIVSAAPPARDLAPWTWNEYLAKPFTTSALVAAIERCCALRRRLARS